MSTTELSFIVFKAFLVVFSACATGLSLLFMLFPDRFRKLEEVLGLEIGWESSLTTVLEGKITVINDWAYRNHIYFGPLLAIIAALNTRNAFFF